MALEKLHSLIAGKELGDPGLFNDALAVKVQGLLDEAKAVGTFVSSWDKLQDLLLEAQLARKSRMPPDFVGVHKMNRSNFGLSGADVHAHGDEILQSGFSWRRASDATAVEIDPTDKDAKSFNEKLANLSGGLIPALRQLKLLSIGSSHTNAFLRALNARCRTNVDRLKNENGLLDPDFWCMRQPQLKDALEGGLMWFVIHRDVPKVWPDLIDCVQRALNTQAVGGQSEVEVMLSMHSIMQSNIRDGKDPDWNQITKAAGFSMPACTPYIHVLADFVQHHAGNGELLEELSLFQKTIEGNKARSKRILGSLFLSRISAMSFGKAIKCPHIQTALIKANLASPKNKITDGMCHLVTPQHVLSMTSKQNLGKTKQIDTLMLDARSLLAGLPNLRSDTKVRALGMLDIRLVTHVLNLGKHIEEQKFDNVGQIVKVHAAAAAFYSYIYPFTTPV